MFALVTLFAIFFIIIWRVSNERDRLLHEARNLKANLFLLHKKYNIPFEEFSTMVVVDKDEEEWVGFKEFEKKIKL